MIGRAFIRVQSYILANLVLGLYLLVTLGFLDGTPGPNQFGDSPKGFGASYSNLADDYA